MLPSSSNSTRKATTVIHNPYAKKRPRPNPSAATTSTASTASNNGTINTGGNHAVVNATSPAYQSATSQRPPQTLYTRQLASNGTLCRERPPTSAGRPAATSNVGSSLNHVPQNLERPSSNLSTVQSTNQNYRVYQKPSTVNQDNRPDNQWNKQAVVNADSNYRPPMDLTGTSYSQHHSSTSISTTSNPSYNAAKISNNKPQIGNVPLTSNAVPKNTVPQSHSNQSNIYKENPSSVKPPPIPPSSHKINGMASLRPTSWSNSSVANANPNHNTNSNNPARNEAPNLSQQFLSKEGTLVSCAVDPLQASLPKELQFSPTSILPVEDSRRRDLVKHANISKPLANGWTLFDHQKRAILTALKMRRFILALDMGLGKTLIGCVWARSFQKTFENCKVIIICPVSLKQEWTRTAVEATELQVEAEEGKPKAKKKKSGKTEASDGDHDDDVADGEEKEKNSTPKVQIFSWAKVPTSIDKSVENYVVICDEAHSLQSMQAARTRELLTLVKPNRCVGVLLLTGTPMKNGRPSNLFPLLRAVRHPFGNNQRAYETHFCAGRSKAFGHGAPMWDASGASNLPVLRVLVSSHLLHLKKDDVLKTLPKQTRKFEHVPVSHRVQREHTQALLELGKLFETAPKDNPQALLNASERLRYVSAVAKVDATVAIAKRVLENEPALVIFTSFVKVAKSIHEKLENAGWTGEILTGETPPAKRQPMVDKFQAGLSSVFVCTFGAGGVGLTLTAARTVILLDRPWTPGDAHQAEDRVRRIGQKFPVTSIWVTAFEVDKQIDTVLESKSQTSNAVLSGGEGSGAVPKLSIFQLIKTILPTNKSCVGSVRQGQEGGGQYLSQTSIDSFYGKQ